MNENFSREDIAATNLNFDNHPKVDEPIQLPNRRNFVPPAKYICKVCGKLYLGDKKIAKHLKHFPSHEFATPEPPNIPVAGAAKDTKKGQTLESYISECDANSFIEQVGPKLFKSFSLWDLLVNKTISKRLGTVESLMSLFADMQAVVMELKNLVEQCLSCERTNQDSFSVTLTPIMSSVLGLSQSGGARRFVLPYTQIPEHYHKLLSFPTGLRGPNIVSSSTHPNLMSPESTNSIIHPEEENSQMSLSSDILDQDQPLGDKVVLEDNLGTRQIHDEDEETQDSSIIASSPGNPHKRQRLDSESHSVTSPPPQTPDFLSQGDDSNLSLSSMSTAVTETVQLTDVHQDGQKKNVNIESSAIISSVCSSVGSLHTKLPSFSSIINGSPKEAEPEADEPAGDAVTTSLYSADTDSSVDFTGSSTALTTSSSTMMPLPPNRVACLNPEPYSVPSVRTEALGGSAPVSPRVSYGGSHLVSYNRRCSLDNINRTSPQDILGLSAKLEHTNSALLDMGQETEHSQLPAINISVDQPVTSQAVWAPPLLQQQEHQTMSGYIKLNPPDSFQQNRQQLTPGSNSPSGTEFEHLPISKSSILKAVPKQQTFPQGTSTHVTFSEELTHPIPSVSPAKDFRDIDLKRHPSESQSSSIFSDLESVLNEATDFSFHPELGDSERLQVKTPDKLLASVPPAVIMDNKKSAISFDNILDFDKNNEGKTTCNQPSSSNEDPGSLTILTQNILENQTDFSFTDSPATGS